MAAQGGRLMRFKDLWLTGPLTPARRIEMQGNPGG
jgi:hypothetical protein